MLEIRGKTVIEDAGVMPNPTEEKRCEDPESPAATMSTSFPQWAATPSSTIPRVCSTRPDVTKPPGRNNKRGETVTCTVIPIGAILAMGGTGFEMNGRPVITNHARNREPGHIYGEELYPKFALRNPGLTFILPGYQMMAGFFDIMSHILERYISGDDDTTSDYLSEWLPRSLIHSARIAAKHPEDHTARSNTLWTARP